MNPTERIIHYSKNFEQTPPHEDPEMQPKTPWYTEGCVEIKDVVLRCCPELPDILRRSEDSVTEDSKYLTNHLHIPSPDLFPYLGTTYSIRPHLVSLAIPAYHSFRD